MNKEVVILVAEDNDGHAGLICKNLIRAGITNPIIRFQDGQETIDFLFCRGEGPHREPGKPYVLLLDIRMPKLDGTDVLKAVKSHDELKKIPIIMVTTTDDPREVALCHALGCSNYVTKPVEYEAFVHAIRQVGLFLTIVEVPNVETSEKET